MNWLALIIQYFPVVLQSVVSVETALKSTPGATKKQIVLDIIKTGTAAAAQIPEAHVQAIGGLIDTVVGALNKSGVFTTSSAPAPATVATGGIVASRPIPVISPI